MLFLEQKNENIRLRKVQERLKAEDQMSQVPHLCTRQKQSMSQSFHDRQTSKVH